MLKKRKRYKAKGDADCLHRDIMAMNACLLANIFDASGNYLYCAATALSLFLVFGRNVWPVLRKVKLPAEHKLDIMGFAKECLGLCRFIPFLDRKGRVFKRNLNSVFCGGGGTCRFYLTPLTCTCMLLCHQVVHVHVVYYMYCTLMSKSSNVGK